MSIPGLAIPGLTSLSTPTLQETLPTASAPRHHQLTAETEWRFEASFARPLTIKILSGNAELFGTELAPSTPYTFKGTKGAIFTWQGCQLEVTGESEAEYVAEETPMTQYANVHFGLENARTEALARGDMAPRVLVVGPENSGKTSLVKMLTAYAVKSGRQPVVVNLDPRQGLLSIPGALTATTMASMLDAEEGWGSSPISGPTTMPVKMPLAYHFGCANAEENEKLYRALITRLGLAVKSRMQEDADIKSSGVFIDTPGSVSAGKAGNYDLIQHIVSELSVNAILILGSERLFNDLKRRFTDLTVLRLDKSGGCVDRDETYMKALRQAQIKEYFFGHGLIPLSPHTIHADSPQLTIYRILTPNSALKDAFDPGADDDDDLYEPSSVANPIAASGISLYEKVTPSGLLQNSLLAVTFARATDGLDGVRDAAVMGYVYVAEVDESKKKIKLLSPVGGRAPGTALVWGQWPEEVASLVS